MRRLFRWGFNLAAAVSMLLFVATCVLWTIAQSGDRVWTAHYWKDAGGCIRLKVDLNELSPKALWVRHGFFEWQATRQDLDPLRTKLCKVIGPPEKQHRHWIKRLDDDPLYQFDKPLRVSLVSNRWSDYYVQFSSAIPKLAFMPLLWVVVRATKSWIARRTIGHGCCPFCGYDLRATPDRCPECGTIPSVKGTT
jgi:hypothetical protein